MSVILTISFWILGIILLPFIFLFIYKRYLKFSTKIKSPKGISSLKQINLGGLNQWIFIRSLEVGNPVLLFLHGGPGAPLLGMASSRKYDKELIKHFTVVHWDQRGAGKSYNDEIPIDSITLNNYVADCTDLIDYLRDKFNTPKVFLLAHSGGTLIGIKTAYEYPQKLYAYIGVSQIIHDYEQNKLSYKFILEEAEKAEDLKRQEEIKRIGPPPYESPKVINELASHIGHYGGFLRNNSLKQKLKMVKLVGNFLTSPEYSFKEGLRTFIGKDYNFTVNALWEEMKTVDITKEIESLDVPVYFLQGKYDMTTPTVLVERFYENLNAEKGKNLILFENSGHFPMIEEKEKYYDLLINKILKEIE